MIVYRFKSWFLKFKRTTHSLGCQIKTDGHAITHFFDQCPFEFSYDCRVDLPVLSQHLKDLVLI